MDPTLLMLPVLGVLIVFMFVNSRKRQKQMKADQEEKATKTVPGAKVLLQGGLYGTIVAYDPENLDEPALVEIAPGTIIEVHSQAILRVVEPTVADDADAADEPDAVDDSAADEQAPSIETADETRARLERDADDK
ncbi:MAG: preprotein translocase subunit YajC [Microbacterium sp.]|uniref:Preprotein translocase subunit YajC n=1 Tax=Microbacterium natoriense TaxID=284570 RepID=A0AAW8EZS3_9MICO|nr:MULTISPECIES: preprotein translocase subunit YajC [Microbacterium]MBW8763559.1 preprotein translocase subunit YajC [Microbacterium sp.]MDQ0648369.1 preprotein translocase subunit YajC [Microbacterium natoriense]